jgi:hypothetical protein
LQLCHRHYHRWWERKSRAYSRVLRRELLKLTCLREVNFEENKGRSQRRKPEDSEGEGDTAEWGSMGTALAGGVHFTKQLKIVYVLQTETAN